MVKAEPARPSASATAVAFPRTDEKEKPEIRASRSLWDRKLPKLEDRGNELTAAGIRLGYVDGPEGQTLRIVERPVPPPMTTTRPA